MINHKSKSSYSPVTKRVIEKPPSIQALRNYIPIAIGKVQTRLWCRKTNACEEPTSVQNENKPVS